MNLPFVLLIFGALSLYCELIWPGKYVPGVAGALLVMSSVYWLSMKPTTVLGLALLAAAAGCFLLEALFETLFVAGAAAIVCMSVGFWKLYSTPSIVPGMAFAMSALFGIPTIWLLEVGKRARRNKRADL